MLKLSLDNRRYKKQRQDILSQIGENDLGGTGEPYKENVEKVYQFPDKWYVGKTKTHGDLISLGEQLGNCIGEMAATRTHGECEGSGKCSEGCDGGMEQCETCEGYGQAQCDSCDGNQTVDDPNCDSGTIECPTDDCVDGKLPCETCEETGVDEDGDDCWNCDGETTVDDPECGGTGTPYHEDCDGTGKLTCDNCDGYGELECSNCGGSGELNCSSCDGDGECADCSGTGRNPSEIETPISIKRWMGEEYDPADNMNSDQKSVYGLYDHNGVPRAAFMHAGYEENPDTKGITGLNGRANLPAKPEYQHRLLKYASDINPGESVYFGYNKETGNSFTPEDVRGILSGDENIKGKSRPRTIGGGALVASYTHTAAGHGPEHKASQTVHQLGDNLPTLGMDTKLSYVSEDAVNTHSIYNPSTAAWEMKKLKGDTHIPAAFLAGDDVRCTDCDYTKWQVSNHPTLARIHEDESFHPKAHTYTPKSAAEDHAELREKLPATVYAAISAKRAENKKTTPTFQWGHTTGWDEYQQ